MSLEPDELKFYPIDIDAPGRQLLESVTCDECLKSSDWASVIVGVHEPWLGRDITPDDVIPGEIARVAVVADKDGADVRIEVQRHGGIPGVTGKILITMFSADEAIHLSRLLKKAAKKAIELDPEA